MFRIALCLPGAAQRRGIQTLCEEYFARRVERLEVAVAAEKQLDVMRGADLVFLSLAGPRPAGLEIARALRHGGWAGDIVFLAVGPEYALDAFGVFAIQYLVPPLTETRIFDTLDRVFLARRGPAFPVPAKEGLIRVPYQDIEYVECTDHILHFHLGNGAMVASTTLRAPIKTALADLLQSPRFYQPHRSYVVNLDRVRTLADTEFVLESGVRIPVPRARKEQAKAAFARAMGADE